MNVSSRPCRRQVPVWFLFLALASCGATKADNFVFPPATAPLSRLVIGFGVVNVSYIQLRAEPAVSGESGGYLRRGAVVKILERRAVNTGSKIEGWVLAQGNSQGWLREEVVDIYDNERQARTAAESLPQ